MDILSFPPGHSQTHFTKAIAVTSMGMCFDGLLGLEVVRGHEPENAKGKLSWAIVRDNAQTNLPVRLLHEPWLPKPKGVQTFHGILEAYIIGHCIHLCLVPSRILQRRYSGFEDGQLK
jgi:hypothetical protein